MLAGGLLALSGPPAHAAGGPWSPIAVGVNATLNAVVVLDQETEEETLPVVVAVGDNGTVVRSEDGGDTWTNSTVPPLGGALPSLRAVHFATPTTGYAVGSTPPPISGVVYRSDDAGQSWRLLQSLSTVGVGVWFTSESVGHVVGRSGAGATILRTTDGGTTWETTFTDPAATQLRAVSFSTSEIGLAVGQGALLAPGSFSGLILRTADGGQSWQRGSVAGDSRFPGPLASVGWASSAGGSAAAYAVGRGASAVSSFLGQTWRSDDDGASWIPQPSGAAPFELHGVDFLDESRGHAVGGGAEVPLILETEDGGVTWTANPVLDVPNFTLVGVAYARDDVRFAVGTGGKVLRYTPEAGPEGIVEPILDPQPPEVSPPHAESRCPSWDPASPTGNKAIFEEGILKRADGAQLDLVAVDARAGLLYEFEEVVVHDGAVTSLPPPARVRVWARDLDTLCLFPRPVLLEDAAADSIAYGPVAVPVVDEEDSRLFFVYRRGPSELYRRGHPTEPKQKFSRATDLGLAVIGADPDRPGTIAQLAAAPFPPGLPPSPQIAASTYYPGQGDSGPLSRPKLYVVLDYSNLTSSGNAQLSSFLVFLLQIDVESLVGGGLAPFDWVLPVPACGRTPNDPAGSLRSAIVRADRFVGIACAEGRVIGDRQQGTVGGVARIELDDLANPGTVRFFPANGTRTNQPTLADPVSGRLFVGALTRRGTGLAGFDVARGAWFGFIPEEREITMLAVNGRTGRLYMGTRLSGVTVSDARALDLPQGSTFPIDVDHQRTQTEVDAVHGRLFTIDGFGDIRVIRDTSALDPPLPPLDPDSLTRDIEEVEGLTGRTFTGGGQAYGVRVRWVNGSRGLQDHSGFCGSAPFGPLNRPGLPFCPHSGTREVVLAQVPGADLADSESSAEAVGAEQDGAGRQEGTDRDLATLAHEEPDELLVGRRSDSEEPDPREQLADEYRKFKQENAPPEYERLRETRRANTVPNRWPYRRVSCADFGGSPQEGSASEDGAVLTVPTAGGNETVPATFSSAVVTCNQQAGLVAANAVFGEKGQLSSPDGLAFIDVGSTRTSAISHLDPTWGLVSQVKAEVTGLRIAHPDQGEVSIGLLRTMAETRASGSRDPGAGGSFERHIEDVWFKRKGDPEPQRLCDQCDSQAVIAELNRVFGTRAHFDLPEPDPERIGGTPGGAEAVVTRHPQEQTSDVVTNEEGSDRLEVPGLLITVFADELTGFSRYIVQLAGVSADSKMGIYCVYGDNNEGACNPAPVLPDAPSVTLPSAPPLEVADQQIEVVFEGDEYQDEELVAVEQAVATKQAPPTVPNGLLPSLVRRIVEGFRFLFNSVIDALRSAGLWMLLAGPLVIYVRRRWLPAPPARGD